MLYGLSAMMCNEWCVTKESMITITSNKVASHMVPNAQNQKQGIDATEIQHLLNLGDDNLINLDPLVSAS